MKYYEKQGKLTYDINFVPPGYQEIIFKSGDFEDYCQNPGKYEIKNGEVIDITDTEEYKSAQKLEVLRTETLNALREAEIELGNSDYKIVKSYEYQLLGLEIPYDLQSLHAEREELRERINEFREILASIKN